MADEVIKSGENHTVVFGSTTLGTARGTQLELAVGTVDIRASGDAGARQKPLGLAHGSVRVDYLIGDEATFALLGKTDTLVLKDSAGTTVFSAGALCLGVRRREGYHDATIVDMMFSVQGLPSVPDLSHLAFGS